MQNDPNLASSILAQGRLASSTNGCVWKRWINGFIGLDLVHPPVDSQLCSILVSTRFAGAAQALGWCLLG